ncbi:MAG: hypothetical protein AAF399_19670 [Bacteroidota bacterium]
MFHHHFMLQIRRFAMVSEGQPLCKLKEEGGGGTRVVKATRAGRVVVLALMAGGWGEAGMELTFLSCCGSFSHHYVGKFI